MSSKPEHFEDYFPNAYRKHSFIKLNKFGPNVYLKADILTHVVRNVVTTRFRK